MAVSKILKITDSEGTVVQSRDIGAEAQYVDISRDSQGKIIPDITAGDVTVASVQSVAAAIKNIEEGSQPTLTFDTTPTANSLNPVTSNGIYEAIQAESGLSLGSTKPVQNKVVTNALNSKLATYAGDATAWDTTPIANSTKPVTSGGVYAAIQAGGGGSALKNIKDSDYSGNVGGVIEGATSTIEKYTTNWNIIPNVASGDFSHAEGLSVSVNNEVRITLASGLASHAEGYLTSAIGDNSHAEGYNTCANGSYSHAEGEYTRAISWYSHAEGYSTSANADTTSGSHAEGYRTSAYGSGNHAEGNETCAIGSFGSHAEGKETIASGNFGSHAEGQGTSSMGGYGSHAEGYQTCTNGYYGSHAEGQETSSVGGYGSHAEGKQTIANKDSSHAEGQETTANAEASHAEGYQTSAQGEKGTHAEGYQTCVYKSGSSSSSNNEGAHAEGYQTYALNGKGAHAEGKQTKALGNGAHAEGQETTAQGDTAHSEGYKTYANTEAHAEGGETYGGGYYSHAEGYQTSAIGRCSHAGGSNTKAYLFQTVVGKFNVEKGAQSTTTGSYVADSGYFIVGSGTTEVNANCFRATESNTYGQTYATSGADYAEMFEWLDNNQNNEDRVGKFVTLDEDKIKLATSNDDYILGIVSGNASVIGDVYDDQWQGMFETDIYGRPIYIKQERELEDGTKVYDDVFKVSENYDNTQKYIPRSERSEWDAVGLVGKLICLDDGTSIVNGYVKVNDDSIATKSDEKTKFRVMKRIDENHIQIMIL